MDTGTDNEWWARHCGNLAGLNAGQATRIEMTDEATGMVKNSLRINYDRGNVRQATRASEEAGHKGGGGVWLPRMREQPSHSTTTELTS